MPPPRRTKFGFHISSWWRENLWDFLGKAGSIKAHCDFFFGYGHMRRNEFCKTWDISTTK